LSSGVTAGHAKLISERRERLRQDLLGIVSGAGHLIWEVGSGHGHFLSAYAAAHPGNLCVGIDISSDRVVRAQRKRERAHLKNLNFILADADDFLAAMPEGVQIAEVFLLFPDPWPKRRHHKNRVLKPEFFATLAKRAAKGARLYFRTDHEDYYREAVEMVRAHPDWTECPGETLPFEEPTVFQMRAERHFTLVAKRTLDKKSA
jgi:tRNA (guanine-N7-)-methyltransferase